MSPNPDPSSIFDSEDLPYPPVPEGVAAALEPSGETAFSTLAALPRPYYLEHYLDLLDRAEASDYAVVGFDGHGINSWAAHYYLVSGPLALFIQLPWGGVYMKHDVAKREITRTFEWAKAVQTQMFHPGIAERIPRGWRLAVVISRFAQSGWRWVPPASAGVSSSWVRGASTMNEVSHLMTELASGTGIPGPARA